MEGELKFVDLGDGRRLSYEEKGCSSTNSNTKTVVALHGMMSSRLCAMPGVSIDTLQELGVRLIVLDRPGYGQSDPHPKQTLLSFCHDLEALIDAIDPGKKIWLLGYSMGGAYSWAAARHIPHRIAGIALWAPVGYLLWKGISKSERKAIVANYSSMHEMYLKLAGRMPFCLFRWYGRYLRSRMAKKESGEGKMGLSPEDCRCVERPNVQDAMARDFEESFSKSKGYGLAKDLQLMVKPWGFEIEEVGNLFKGKIHIWQGDKDRLVSLEMQRCVSRMLPGKVHLHELLDEGHLSWFCFNDVAHRQTLTELLRPDEQCP